MLINEVKLIQLFCEADDFMSIYEHKLASHLLPANYNSKHSVNKPRISLSEMMTLEIVYHLSGHKCFEYFYVQEVLQGSLHPYFPHAPSYNRFVELKPRMLVALICYLHCVKVGRQGLKLITAIRSNMKNRLMLLHEKMLLKKRGMIESVIDILKSVCNIEHTRHHSPPNMIVNTYAALFAYATRERKPSILIH